MQKKKGFKGEGFNPATAFISTTQPIKDEQGAPAIEGKPEGIEVGYTPNTDEPKTRRVNMLIRPSLFEDFKKVAHMKRTTPNDLMNRLIADYTEQEAQAIRDYNRMYPEGK